MSRSLATGEFNTFVKGIITEANPLTYPENASLDEQNFVLSRDGSRQRRLGMDYEIGHSFTPNTTLPSSSFLVSDDYVGFYRWDNVGGDPSVSLGLVITGKTIFFIDMYGSSPSASLKNGGAGVALNTRADWPTQFTTFGGTLLCTRASKTLQSFSYDSATDTITTDLVVPVVRDLWGVDERDSSGNKNDLDIEENPVTLEDSHKYNIYNQGWYTEVTPQTGLPLNAADSFFDGHGYYPDNTQIWYVGKRETEENLFFSGDVRKHFFGNTPAPKGHFIIDPFFRNAGRSDASGISQASDNTTGAYTAIASFAGRLFYSGIRVTDKSGDESTAPRLENTILFTQTILNDNDFSKCYQEGDPTSEDSNDLLDTDGGTITIPEANVIYKMVPTGNELVVFAENGIWSILGSEEGFSAKNFQVTKISNTGVVGSESIVLAEASVFYWSKAGIYTLGRDQVSGALVPSNISENSIQTLYLDIPSVSKVHARGSYDEAARKLTWLYNDNDSYTGIVNTFRYNKELILDLTLGAFTKNEVPESTTGPFIASHVQTPNFNSLDVVVDVVSGADDIVSGVDDVVITETTRSRGTSQTKYLTLRATGANVEFTLSEYRDASYLDWFTEDSIGTEAAAFLETGYFIGGDTQREKGIKYLTTHFSRTETGYELDGNGNLDLVSPSGCLVQVKWDFSDSANSGRWGTQFQAYRLNRLYIPENVNDPFDYGFDVVTTKNKIRGHGKAIRFKFDSQPGKDLFLLGWSMVLSQADDV